MKMNPLAIVERKIGDLIPYKNNAREHSEEQIEKIAASITEFNFNNPILLDGKNGVIAGHGRLAAAIKLGLNEVPCIELAHLSEDQKRAYILVDNRLAEDASGASWNLKTLEMELNEISLPDFEDFAEVFENGVRLGRVEKRTFVPENKIPIEKIREVMSKITDTTSTINHYLWFNR